MDEPLGHEITVLLKAWRLGDAQALEKLTPQVYRELHRAAKRCMAQERACHTLQTVAPETVMRDWKIAKAWLLRELSGEKPDGA